MAEATKAEKAMTLAGAVRVTNKSEKEQWGDAVMRYYRFTNAEPSKLGKEPLPDGEVKALRVLTDDNLYGFVGRTSVKYIPVNETVEMELGYDRRSRHALPCAFANGLPPRWHGLLAGQRRSRCNGGFR